MQRTAYARQTHFSTLPGQRGSEREEYLKGAEVNVVYGAALNQNFAVRLQAGHRFVMKTGPFIRVKLTA